MKKKIYYFIGLFAIGIFISCASFSNNSPTDYPETWWAAVPTSELKSWEIPPQAASRQTGDVILSKRTELGIFSNLALTPFKYKGEEYQSVEGLWQSLKYPENPNDPRFDKRVTWKFSRSEVKMLSGFEAKTAGDLANENMKILGISWQSFENKKFEPKGAGSEFHRVLIFDAISAKINQNPNLRGLLKKTGSLRLLPDHQQPQNLTPSYKYNEMLMEIRRLLK